MGSLKSVSSICHSCGSGGRIGHLPIRSLVVWLHGACHWILSCLRFLGIEKKKAVLLLGEWLRSNLSTVEKFYTIPVLLSFQTKSNTKMYKFQNSQWVWFLDDNVSCRQNSMLLIWWQIYLEVMVLLWMPAFLKLWSGCLFPSQQRGTSPCSLYATGKVHTHTHTQQ